MLKSVARRGLVLLAVAAASTAFAQKTTAPAPRAAAAPAAPLNWPTKPLRIIVGFPGGSTPDLVARTIAEPLSKALGQPVVVENKVGAGGNIAADLVVRANDNHTIGFMINGNMTIAKMLNPAVPYDPQRDLQPLSLVGTAPLMLTAPVNAPGNDAQEFFLAARNAADKWSYGTPGVGTVGHIGMELLKTKTNMNPVHVPYPGNPQVIQAMIGNQIQLALLPPGLAQAQVKAGKLKAIGVTSLGRSPLAPEFPSLNELGIRGFQLEIWVAAAAPKSLPKPMADKLSSLISEITRTPEVRAKLFQQGWQAAGTNAEGLANRVKSDTAVLGGVIMMRGIKAE
ncbi:tripartite tricarboxylate transporter substrate binding protein [Ramlibacter sp. USB13]|uniref:Tripartite tricarboxylate transporter substrate binding protein n=1 Tax=Ramlibacter cellulosilyticus TaxID=2764187 RepID=A0A923MX29_9BURK|nr:tripartite tricarboxylate transporter substrate binding protein [Ramlibacter cellulosilyticus]MBC5786284.1 tripartite tricarboxylate transporter substrate binding protein [Ramlibacter cellulosilyticus]